MGECQEHQPPVLLFIAIMASRTDWIDEAIALLSGEFGAAIAQASLYEFDQFTRYYTPEFGAGLKKTIIAVNRLIPPENLMAIKRRTNELEVSSRKIAPAFPQSFARRINLDPGYLNLSKVILATTKDHAHRIYIGQGIFEEITLAYRKKEGFMPNPWTYPDYAAPDRLVFFNNLRQNYLEMLRAANPAEENADANP